MGTKAFNLVADLDRVQSKFGQQDNPGFWEKAQASQGDWPPASRPLRLKVSPAF